MTLSSPPPSVSWRNQSSINIGRRHLWGPRDVVAGGSPGDEREPSGFPLIIYGEEEGDGEARFAGLAVCVPLAIGLTTVGVLGTMIAAGPWFAK
jgi:hypothetical protein